MDEQRQDDQLEHIYNSSVPIQDVAYRERWTIETGGEKGSVRSVLAARHDDDDDEHWEPTNCVLTNKWYWIEKILNSFYFIFAFEILQENIFVIMITAHLINLRIYSIYRFKMSLMHDMTHIKTMMNFNLIENGFCR